MHDLGIIFFPAFDWAISPTHPEREERLLYTQDQLMEEGLFDMPGIVEYRPRLANFTDVERTHFCLPSAEKVCTPSHLASAGGALKAAELVLQKQCKRAFALVRPPGHHAMRITHGNRGFCNINIEAIMLDFMRSCAPCSPQGPLRIAVVDTDCHHGDGSQDIFWNDPNTLFISLHQDGRTLYPGSGFLHECGGPGALGKTINIPLPPHTGDAGYLYAMEHCVLPILADFQPHFVVNSAGQDNHFTDPLANMRLTAQGYARLTSLLKPDIAVLEGGYAIRDALPYVNLAICLALAEKDFSAIYEPQWTTAMAEQKQEISEYIAALCDETLHLYHNPPSTPHEGTSVRQAYGITGPWWARSREIYYDTDMICDKQEEKTLLCDACPGITCTESQSRKVGLSLCVHVPREACTQCKEHAHAIVHDAQKKNFAHVLCNT